MSTPEPDVIVRQHLIDPEACIRCNTCEETCPVDAISHDARNYVVDPSICGACNACLSLCPTGSIDHWRAVPKLHMYTLQEQFAWDELPAQTDASLLADLPPLEFAIAQEALQSRPDEAGADLETPQANAAVSPSSLRAPWSAAHPYVHLYSQKKSLIAMVAGNFRLTAADAQNDVRHIVLDLGTQFMPLLEGQSVGVIPPGVDASGKPHHLRMYSGASPRTGEREGYNNLALTVKRVTVDHEGRPTLGVASNYLCARRRGRSAGPNRLS